jgi:hypothetical protein
MAGDVFSQFINVLQFSSGRRRFAYAQTIAILKELKQKALTTFAEHGIQHDERVAATEQQYYAERASRSGTRAAAIDIDNHFDRTLGALSDQLGNLASLFAPTTDTGRRARKLALAIFPQGAGAVTHSSFEDELAAGDDIVKQLRGPFASDVKELGLKPVADELERTLASFRAALPKEPVQRLGFDAVRAARAGGQRHFERFIAKLLASDELSDANRARVLAPIAEQNARIRSFYAHHRSVPDVNPATGEELPAPADATPPVAPPAPSAQVPVAAPAPAATTGASNGGSAPDQNP